MSLRNDDFLSDVSSADICSLPAVVQQIDELRMLSAVEAYRELAIDGTWDRNSDPAWNFTAHMVLRYFLVNRERQIAPVLSLLGFPEPMAEVLEISSYRFLSR